MRYLEGPCAAELSIHNLWDIVMISLFIWADLGDEVVAEE